MSKKGKNTVHLSLEFPIDEHFHLKMMCARQRKSIKDFVTDCVMKAMRKYEKKVLEGIDEGLGDIEKGHVTYRKASEFEKFCDD